MAGEFRLIDVKEWEGVEKITEEKGIKANFG